MRYSEEYQEKVSPVSDNNSLMLAFGLILVLFCIYALGYLGLAAGIPVNRAEFPLALLLAFLIFFRATRSCLSLRLQVRIVILILGIIVFSAILSFLILDTSWDGQWYHQAAIVKLLNGWNPVRDPFYSLTRFDRTNYLAIQHFPKFSWISAAVIAKFTGWIETGKMINHLVAWAAFFSCFHVLRQFIHRKGWNIAVSGLLVLNPVLVTQLFSDYVDGTLYAFLLIILLQLVSIEISPGFRKFKWAILVLSIIMVSNIKFTGLVLSGVILFCYSAYWLIRRCKFTYMLKRGAAYVLIFAVAVMAFGYNPYLTNLRSGHTLFYPVDHPADYEIIMNSEPYLLRGKSNPEKLFLSLVSRCNNNISENRLHWKDPFSIPVDEILLFSTTDLRLSGFGPLFQLAWWLSLFLLVWNGIRCRKRPFYYLAGVILACILVSTLISPVCWWARLSPQFYLFPFIALIPGLGKPDPSGNKRVGLISKLTVVVLCVNILAIAGANFSANIIKTRMIRSQLETLKRSPGPVRFDFDRTPFQANRRRLQEAGVKFVERDTLKGKVKELQTLYKMEGYGPKYSLPE